MSPKLLLLLFLVGLASSGVTALGWGSVQPVPSESECRPYIEKALKELSAETTQEAVDTTSSPETPQATDTSTEDSGQEGSIEGTESTTTNDSPEEEEGDKSGEEEGKESGESAGEGDKSTEAEDKSTEDASVEDKSTEESKSAEDKSAEDKSEETEEKSGEEVGEVSDSGEADIEKEGESKESGEQGEAQIKESGEDSVEGGESTDKTEDDSTEKESSEEKLQDVSSKEDTTEEQTEDKSSEVTGETQSTEDETTSKEDSKESKEETGSAESQETEGSVEHEPKSSEEATGEDKSGEADSHEAEDKSVEDAEEKQDDSKESEENRAETSSKEESGESVQEEKSDEEPQQESQEEGNKSGESGEADSKGEESGEVSEKEDKSSESEEKASDEKTDSDSKEEEGSESAEGGEPAEEEEDMPEEEELTMEIIIPDKLRPRDHIAQILKLDSDSAEAEQLLGKSIDITLRDLKRLYDSAIKPLEILYKYRDLSNRHFGDPEIFSKPLILFMGPWSGGKSTIINYLLDNEYKKSALRTGAEPSPAYFNILMYGEQEEVLDGTQLAADWTFSGLQKFGQGLLDRLRGLKLNSPLLEKVNIVEIPGILEIRKQVERLFPFNDACQWFIDRADIIFLVYDPSKLDVGPETEAILDQLKGREYQTRIILNKADQVKPEELMRVQGTLIWNISPLMSSSEPPVMYSTSLWSLPYEIGAPTRLLQAQERAFLRDLRDAVDKRVENKIASARRFAVRVRNHAKMVDCYLTTYYNHKSFFGNRKKVADDITEHPQNYHIYEGLSTLTNISRYDLPDPEVYRDFFRLNPLYDFQQLSATCTYFRGCPINRLDVAIAYDLPELVGKYKKSAEPLLASAAGAESPPKS